jgi:PAS domain S-box-containing protein
MCAGAQTPTRDGTTLRGHVSSCARSNPERIFPFLGPDPSRRTHKTYMKIRADRPADAAIPSDRDQDLTEDQRRKSLLKAGALQAAILNSANFSSIATDENGVIQIFNVGAERMLGYTAAEVVNRITPADISDPEELLLRAKALSAELITPIAPGFDAMVFKARRGIEDIYELTYIRKDGSRFPAVVSVTALRDASNMIIGYLLIGTDNTARKQVEEAMRKSEERYSMIFNSMFEGLCIIEVMFDGDDKAIDYRFLETNKAFEAQTGLIDAKGKRMRELVPTLEEHWFEIYGKVAQTGEPAHFENEAQALNRWYEVSAHRFGEDAQRNVSIFFQDITARKLAEAALLKAGALQRAIFESANFSSVATDARGVIQIFNVGAERMLGYAAADVVNTITPADISDSLELIERARQLSAELDIPISPGFEALVFKASRGIEDIYELTYIRKDGSRFPAVVSVTALRDAQDAIIGYLLIGTDNTARQLADGKLRAAGLYARSLIEASLDPLVTISPFGKITDVNEGSVKVTGVSREKLIGTDFSDYFTEPEKARQGYREAFLKGSITDFPLTIRRGDGRLTDVLYNASIYKDVQGNVLGVFAAARVVMDQKKTEAKFRGFVESAPDGVVVVDSTGQIVLVNAKTERLFGYERHEMLGQKLELLMPSRFHTKHLKHREGFMEAPKSRGMGADLDFYGRRKNGSEFPIEVTLSPLETEAGVLISSSIRDVTQQKQASQYARSLIEASLDPLVTISPQGKITDVNEGSVRVTGVPRDKLIGAVFSDYFTEPEKAREGYQEAFLNGSVTDYPLTIRHQNGHLTDVLYNATVYKDVQGNVLGVFAAARDVTKHKLAEAERMRLTEVLQDSLQELKKAKVAADEANLAKSDFLSSMSHELRSPLNAILGFAQLIESGTPPPTATQADSLKQILQAGWYLLELINEILDLARIESGKMSLSLEPISLAEVLVDCQSMINPEAQKSGIQVHFPAPESAAWVVMADRTRIKQVLLNLLSNAIKYNRIQGQVNVRCDVGASGRTRVSVQDTGEGLSADKLSQLFQPFNRLGQEGGAQEGTGIGLVTSKRLVDLMGGRIGVDSNVGVGSVFWFELDPSHMPQSDIDLTDTHLVPAHSTLTFAVGKTLLCVEDNPANLLLVQRLLERRTDIRMLSAVDGQHGVEMARAHQPDVILMDINLPGISGITALRTLAEDPMTAHIPVVALSANAMPHDIEKGLQAGFFRYMTKPIKLNEFMDTLDAALAHATPAGKTE